MGHDVLRCDLCGTDVMEGRNKWECNCGAVCIPGKTKGWEMPSNHLKKKLVTVIDKPLNFIIMF